ncbi:allophanate hydrolase subunit 1 [Pseudidiomarina sp.]|uniref:5-oxoprolinase subunit B family protein n=1 Tax=Pseudidiomarina sp. TaxID=2081707 RepID=UPI00299DFEAC|nr:allophanate hydrolase subunit 1 [Pseudidiomarina sp.]MDX1705690.1 allophanate hydrolase subunit 1 [Pseudidiomarina sp.]
MSSLNNSDEVRIVSAAVDAVMVEFDAVICPRVNRQVHALKAWLGQNQEGAIAELVPAYRTLMVYYDIALSSEAAVRQLINEGLQQLQGEPEAIADAGAVVSVEVCYDPQVALDIEAVADLSGCSIDEVIRLHTTPDYLVYALGFAPGFAYMGDVPERLRLPRLDTPRQKVPAGSVAIANQQTAIYPRQSPGGWRIIGRVRKLPQLQPGDQVKFVAISLAEFNREPK